MSKHTTEAWNVVTERDGARFIACGSVRIAKICGGTAISAFPRADSTEVKAQRSRMHLIAAAPDLLAILETIIGHGIGYQDLEDLARAAIAKAQGSDK